MSDEVMFQGKVSVEDAEINKAALKLVWLKYSKAES